jgi:3-hydroxybutyrate dehydrogenase
MLNGKYALVTGSTSGIGMGIAQALAAQGVNLMLNGFGDAGEIERTRAQLEQEHGIRAIYCGADMARPGEVEAMVAEAVNVFGRIDILVNNAGIQHVAPIEELPPEKWDAILAINLSSAFHTIRTALPVMMRNNWGRIVNIASVHGLVASPFKSAYVAAKHGLVGLTKTVALETAGKGITCNAVCPGFVRTPLVEKQIDDLASANAISKDQMIQKMLAERQPSKQFVQIEEVAALAVFLCTDAAASITGSAVNIDGGWMAL